jgi:hypothetical protein
MTARMIRYERLFVEFLYYFNVTRDYFECHEVLEQLWMEEGRDPLLQGLLQVAVGLYHHRNGNVSGARKLFGAAVDKLAHHPPDALGIDLGRLLADAREYKAKLERSDGPPAFYDLDIHIVDPALADKLEELKADPPVPHDEEGE